jgi:hypothetical protein
VVSEPHDGDAGGFPGSAPYGQTDTAHLLIQLEGARIALRRTFEDPFTMPMTDVSEEALTGPVGATDLPAAEPRLIGGPVW